MKKVITISVLQGLHISTLECDVKNRYIVTCTIHWGAGGRGGWVTQRELLTEVGIHDKEVEVLLQVTAVFGNLSSEEVEYGSQQVVT